MNDDNVEKNKQLRECLKAQYLSNDDLDYILHPDTNIYPYNQLYNFRHIDEIFDKLGRCILLYPTHSETVGHWVCIIKRNNIIEYFDPYGFPPDTSIQNLGTPQDVAKRTGQDIPKLLKMIQEAGYNLEYNNKKFQKLGDDIGTCGRHTASRLIFHKLPLKKYSKLLNELKNKHLKDYDDIVTKLTHDLLTKIKN